ncbi:MAG: transposase [Bacteroidetes bacterium]|nr:transposase [Bacteroidota bacterium]
MNTNSPVESLITAYFCTFTIVQDADLFTLQVYRDIVIDSLNFCEEHKGLRIHAYVFMSNHIHCILSAVHGNLSSILRDSKSFSSKAMFRKMYEDEDSRQAWLHLVFEYAAGGHRRNKDFQIWKHFNQPEALCSSSIIRQKIDYIHNSPVRAGWVAESHHWLYSSASDYRLGRQVGNLKVSLFELQ